MQGARRMTFSDCISCVERAWNGMIDVLFKPFDIVRWMGLGFLAWLACLMEGAGMPSFNGLGDMSRGGKTSGAWNPSSAEITTIVAIAVAALVLIVLIALLVLWVKCRGRFMFVDELAKKSGKADVKARWKAFAPHGNSLFLFTICWHMLSAAIVLLPILGALGIFLYTLKLRAWDALACFQYLGSKPSLICVMVALVLLGFLLALVNAVFLQMIMDFGTLHMYKNGSGAWTAAVAALKALFALPFRAAAYIGVLIAVNIAIGLFTLAVFMLGCLLCLSCILLYIPYTWAVILLPALCFRRLFSMEFAKHFGEAFAIEIVDSKNKPEEASANSQII